MKKSFPSLKNDRFLRALHQQPVDATPVWLMRQAGRYLPEYRAVRQKAGDFMTLCKTPELACEVTLQPLRRFDLDAAIIFSDILTIPDALGLDLYFVEGEGPRFAHAITTPADIKKLPPFNIEALNYVSKAIQLTKNEIAEKLPLIGFSGSPWTIATYMLEGGASKTFSKAKAFMFNHPEAMHELLHLLTQAIIQYLTAQIQSGANAVMIFDTWGGILTPKDYLQFSLHYMHQIVKQIQTISPCILFTKGGGQWLEKIAETGCQGIGLDWTINIGEAKKRVGNQVALQGNLDPALLYADEKRICQEVKNILEDYGHPTGHIFNLGHGINPDTPYKNVEILVEAVHKYS